MEDVGLKWNPKKCAVAMVAHVQGEVHTHTHNAVALRVDESIVVTSTSKRAISTSSWVS